MSDNDSDYEQPATSKPKTKASVQSETKKNVKNRNRPKRYLSLSIEEKKKILNMLETSTIAQVALKVNMPRSSIYNVVKRKDELIELSNKIGSASSRTRKRLRAVKHPQLDTAVNDWYNEQQQNGVVLADAIIRKKCFDLHKKMCTDSKCSFNASTGWLKSFKSRYIRIDDADNVSQTDDEFQEATKLPVQFAATEEGDELDNFNESFQEVSLIIKNEQVPIGSNELSVDPFSSDGSNDLATSRQLLKTILERIDDLREALKTYGDSSKVSTFNDWYAEYTKKLLATI